MKQERESPSGSTPGNRVDWKVNRAFGKIEVSVSLQKMV